MTENEATNIAIGCAFRVRPIPVLNLNTLKGLLKSSFLILLVCASSWVSGSAQPAKRLFEIPPYPDTLPFNENSSMKRLQAPFATSLMVYRTADGSRLDKEKIIDFYRSHLESKGWKDDTFKRRGGEAYLGLRVDLFEDLEDGTRIQLSGNFYLWVAPQDGIYTILLDQWRISSFNQKTLNYISSVIRSLEGIGAKRNYHAQKVYSDGDWDKDYENEYLIDRVHFTFLTGQPAGFEPGSNQMIDLIILTYRDSAIAEDEAKRLTPPSTTNVGDGKVIGNLSTVFNVVVVKNRTVLLIRDYSGKQREAVKLIAADLEKL